MKKVNLPEESKLFFDIGKYIEESKMRVAISVNSELVLLYWKIGNRIKKEILKDKRAEYGRKIIISLSEKLIDKFGRNWSEKQIRHCLRCAETFSKNRILSAVRRQLSWTHIKTIMYIDDEVKRDFYLEMSVIEKWSTRLLQNRINTMLFERTAISKKPEKTIKTELKKLKSENKISSDLVFRDPYILDFLGLKDTYSEKDLESSIISELQNFIIEMGNDFAFLARQKRITIDNRDYKIDLLFYHRRLKCLIAIDLKLGEFEAGYKGQMELYLNYLKKYETVEDENSPVGLILCTGKNSEHIELLQLNKSNIKVADYFTVLPPKKLLLEKLHKAIEIAKIKSVKKESGI